MSSQIDKIIDIALGEVGYLEKASNANLDSKTANAGYNNYTKYGKWYQENVDGSDCYINAYWCDMFKTWCANQAGVTKDQIPYTAYTPTGVNWFKNKGRWHNPSGYTPKKGDVIYFKNSHGIACHVGLVYACDGKTVYTVEGNTSSGSGVVDNGGAVAKKSYSLANSRILGYGTPLYKTEEDITTAQFNALLNSMLPAIVKVEIDKYFAERKSAKVSDWAKKEGVIETAVKAGISDGTSPRMFMKREEFTAMIIRYMNECFANK